MANFNSNQWYQLTAVSESTDLSMAGTILYDHGQGAVFFQVTNTTHPAQQWQIYPFNSSTYILRTKESGHDGYLCVAVYYNGTTPGYTVPQVRNYTLTDDSMFWQITPWGDGTFYFTNAANGTAWHLDVLSNTLMSMSSNITAPQDGQRYSFTQLGAINDKAFSTINTPLATSIPTSSTTSGSPTGTAPASATSASATNTSSSSSSKGLSSGASAAIGASIGAVALIALIIVAWVLHRRRKRPVSLADPQYLPPNFPQELQTSEVTKYEMQVPPAELQGPLAELQGNTSPVKRPDATGYNRI
ncbi:hypothetical protein AOQ84DRAFT_108680 [Glonium stellatum]|uniref:Ricin B lectin domain-containing protein n=1 Tax=Glonium stellatum TaxID=574774 RepID=A0A8E2JY62_9PEZI|nr:hypothetical protein AOQ84DRAFT_108680 [Glonium stellatum]